MSRGLLIPLSAAALLWACSSPQRAAERACRKADRLMAKAVHACPILLQVDTASRTVTLVLPGDSLTTTVGWEAPQLDSLKAACDQLAEALAAERDLYRLALASASDSTRARRSMPPVGSSPAVQAAVQATRTRACTWEPFTYYHDRALVLVTPGADGRPVITVDIPELRREVPCPPCPPQMVVRQEVKKGVAEWYRTYFWVSIGACLLLLIGALLNRRYR